MEFVAYGATDFPTLEGKDVGIGAHAAPAYVAGLELVCVSFDVRAVDGMSVLDPVESWDATDPALVFAFRGDSSFLETLLWLGEGGVIRSMMVFSGAPARPRDLPGGDFHETSDLVLPTCE